MKYTVTYLLRRDVVFDIEEGMDLLATATAHARQKSGSGPLQIIQILPEGVASSLLDDQAPEPPTLPRPPSPPGQAPGGDQMDLRRAA